MTSAITEKEVESRIGGAVPTPGRRQRLQALFISSVREANENGRHCWAVTSEPKQVRLIVGHLIVATLEDDSIWLSLDGTSIQDGDHLALGNAPAWRWAGPDEYPVYVETPATNGYYTPSLDTAAVWPLIRNLHYSLIFRASRGRAMDPRTPANHCPAVLSYLRNSMGIHVPDPLYGDEVVG